MLSVVLAFFNRSQPLLSGYLFTAVYMSPQQCQAMGVFPVPVSHLSLLCSVASDEMAYMAVFLHFCM